MGKYRLPRTFNWNTLELYLSSASFDARVIESVQSRLNRSTRPSFLFLYIFFLLVFFPLPMSRWNEWIYEYKDNACCHEEENVRGTGAEENWVQ